MQGVGSLLVLIVVVVGMFGCQGEQGKQLEQLNEFAHGQSSDNVQLLKERAQSLTLGGRREDGVFYIDYTQPSYMDVVIFAKRAKDYLERNGELKAIDDFMSPQSQFVAGRMYVFAYSTSGECLADWAEPNKIGCYANSPFVESAVAAGQAGGGWVESMSTDPLTKRIRHKESYVLLADKNIIIGAGLYKD